MSTWSGSYLVAGLRLEIVSSVGDASGFLPPGMGNFQSSGRSDLLLELWEDEAARADPLKRFFPSKFTLTQREEGFAFEGINGGKRNLGAISKKRDRGEMGLPLLDEPFRIEEEKEAVQEALQAFVKACLQCRLLEEDGTLLHAAGIALGEEGFAFTGHTRAGKTTLMRDLPPPAVLGDDLVAVRKTGEKFLLFGTPWPGREGGVVAYGGLPLWAVFTLHPELPAGLRRLGSAEAVAELAANAPRLGYAGEEDELLAIFSSASSTHPIYELSMSMGDDLISWLVKFEKEEEKGHRTGIRGQTA